MSGHESEVSDFQHARNRAKTNAQSAGLEFRSSQGPILLVVLQNMRRKNDRIGTDDIVGSLKCVASYKNGIANRLTKLYRAEGVSWNVLFEQELFECHSREEWGHNH